MQSPFGFLIFFVALDLQLLWAEFIGVLTPFPKDLATASQALSNSLACDWLVIAN